MNNRNKMPRFLLLSALGASLFLGAPALASAAPGGPDADIATNEKKPKRAKLKKRAKQHKAKKGHKKMAKKMCEVLECTDEQKADIRKVRKSMKAEFAPVKGQMRSLHAELEAERAKPSPNPERVAELREAMKEQRSIAKGLRGEGRERVKSILTPAQRAEFERLVAQRKAGKRKHKAGKRGERAKGERDIARRGGGKGQGKGKRKLAV